LRPLKVLRHPPPFRGRYAACRRTRRAWSGRAPSKPMAAKSRQFRSNFNANLSFCIKRALNALSNITEVERLTVVNLNPKEAVLKRSFLNFLSDESGATAIEYGLIAAGISLAIIAIVNGIGSNLNDKFTSINSSLK
jgi:pilus assembly protein Flp/PilA